MSSGDTAAADVKRTATLTARAALVGVQLHRLDDGRWLLMRWGLNTTLFDDEVEPWLRQMGAPGV